jgi:hypothetical protein
MASASMTRSSRAARIGPTSARSRAMMGTKVLVRLQPRRDVL